MAHGGKFQVYRALGAFYGSTGWRAARDRARRWGRDVEVALSADGCFWGVVGFDRALPDGWRSLGWVDSDGGLRYGGLRVRRVV